MSAVQQELVVNADVLRQKEQAVRQYKSAADIVAAIDAIGGSRRRAVIHAQKGERYSDSARDLYDTYYSEYNDNTLITNLSASDGGRGSLQWFPRRAERRGYRRSGGFDRRDRRGECR